MAMARECFCFDFCFGASCGAIMFAVATGTNISSSLGRQDRPVLSLSFLDVYGTTSSYMDKFENWNRKNYKKWCCDALPTCHSANQQFHQKLNNR
jgi:hypothetical protein